MASKPETLSTCNFLRTFIILVCSIEPAFGDLLYVQSQAEVIRGGNITIPCATTFIGQFVHWQHTPVGSNGAIDIFYTGVLIRKFQGKYYVKKDEIKGEYNLTILAAAAKDAGTYTCIDKGGVGQQRRTELTVLDSQPIGQSNVSLEQLSICGTTSDYIGLSCHVGYTGDQSPNIEWIQIFKNGTNASISSRVQPEILHNSVTYYIATRVDPSMDGSVIRCQSTLEKYSWTSDELKIQYALNSSSIVVLHEAKHVECNATTNRDCSYWWTRADDPQKIQSTNEILDLAGAQFGTYTCVANCNIRGKPCVIFGQTVQHTEDVETDNTSTNSRLISAIAVSVIVITLVTSGIVIAYCFLRRHKRRKTEYEKDENLPLLDEDKNLTPTPDMERLIVRGMAELGHRIYIIFQEKKTIRVISDLVNFVKESDITVDMMEDPWDVESCAESQCLYVADRGPNCIWRVDPFSNSKPLAWMVGLKKPHKFSVISGGRVAVPRWPSSVEIRKPDGALVETIELPTDLLEPYYVLETSRNTFVVAHGHQKSRKHRVCEICRSSEETSEWQVQWSYPENGSDKISNIDILAMDDKGRIFVTDQNNLRIIILSKNGQRIRAIQFEKYPYRLCYARNKRLLLVSHFGAISLYKVNDVSEEELEVEYLREVVCPKYCSYPSEHHSKTTKAVENLEMQPDYDSGKTMDIGDNIVKGIAELHKKFYVILQDKSFIRVFDGKCKKLGDIPVEDLCDPWFIDACPRNNCLYITDKGRECIVKITNLGRKNKEVTIEIWKRKIGEPFKLSVTSDGNVVIPTWPLTLEVLDSLGQLKDNIALPEDMREPCHVVESGSGSYILGHGDKKSDTHRVCKISYSNSKGCEVLWTYGNQRGKEIHQLNRPRNIVIDEKGRVCITDEGNRRLVLLDKNGIRLSTELTELTPERLFYSKSSGRLLVGQYGSVSQYVIDEADRHLFRSLTECLKSASDV